MVVSSSSSLGSKESGDASTTRHHHQTRGLNVKLKGSTDTSSSSQHAPPISTSTSQPRSQAPSAPVQNSKRMEEMRRWTPEEDDMVIKLRGEGKSWAEVATYIPGRTGCACMNRYSMTLKSIVTGCQGRVKNKSQYKEVSEEDSDESDDTVENSRIIPLTNRSWSEEEDRLIVSLKRQGYSWNDISDNLPERTVAACSRRYAQALRTVEQAPREVAINSKVKWTAQEDSKMLLLKGKGYTWERIAKQIPNRSVIACERRFSKITSGGANPTPTVDVEIEDSPPPVLSRKWKREEDDGDFRPASRVSGATGRKDGRQQRYSTGQQNSDYVYYSDTSHPQQPIYFNRARDQTPSSYTIYVPPSELHYYCPSPSKTAISLRSTVDPSPSKPTTNTQSRDGFMRPPPPRDLVARESSRQAYWDSLVHGGKKGEKVNVREKDETTKDLKVHGTGTERPFTYRRDVTPNASRDQSQMSNYQTVELSPSLRPTDIDFELPKLKRLDLAEYATNFLQRGHRIPLRGRQASRTPQTRRRRSASPPQRSRGLEKINDFGIDWL